MVRSLINDHRAKLFHLLVLLLVYQGVEMQPGAAPNGTEYFVDVLMVSDLPIYNAWFQRAQVSANESQRDATLNDLRRYFTLVMQEVNTLYRTLERYNDFRLTIRPVGFSIAQTPEQSQWTLAAREDGVNGKVDSQRALRNLARWVANTPGLPQHDHTMLLTGATVASLCQGGGRSVSIIEDRGAFQSVQTAAHELGHSLGARHDGAGNTCLATDRFIMAGGTEPRTPQNLRHPWCFSPCSAQEIARYVGRLLNFRFGRQCLETALPQIGVPNVQGLIPGQMYGPDEQCQHIYGPQSRYCQGGNFGTLDQICTSMFCLVPGDRRRNFCVQYHAAHGTTCGPGRWCEQGACVANQNASEPAAALGQCPFGDQQNLVNRRRCPQAVTAQPAICYNARVRTTCCASCPRVQLNITGCEYGDLLPRLCRPLRNNNQTCNARQRRQCCLTCDEKNNVIVNDVIQWKESGQLRNMPQWPLFVWVLSLEIILHLAVIS